MRQLSCETTISIFPNHPNIEPCDRIPRVGMLNYSVKQRYYQTSAFIAYSRPMRLFFQIQVPIFSSSLSERIQAQIFTSSSSERLRAVAFSKFQRVVSQSWLHILQRVVPNDGSSDEDTSFSQQEVLPVNCACKST